MLTFKRVHTHTHVLDSRARNLKFYIHNSYITHTHMLTFKHTHTHVLDSRARNLKFYIHIFIHNSYIHAYFQTYAHTHVLDSRARYFNKFYIHNSYITHTYMLTFKHARIHTWQTLVHAILISFIYTIHT